MSRKKKKNPELCKNTLWEGRFDNKILKSILKMFNIEVIFRAMLHVYSSTGKDGHTHV